jgi:hypothetical protein
MNQFLILTIFLAIVAFIGIGTHIFLNSGSKWSEDLLDAVSKPTYKEEKNE